jgi:hypothetical protein
VSVKYTRGRTMMTAKKQEMTLPPVMQSGSEVLQPMLSATRLGPNHKSKTMVRQYTPSELFCSFIALPFIRC